MSLKMVAALFVAGLVALASAAAIKPHITDYKPVPSVSYESEKTADHEQLTLGLYWGNIYTIHPWSNNASSPRFIAGPEKGCNTVEQNITWPLLEVFWEFSSATVGEENADGSVSLSLGKTPVTASFTACKEDGEYELDLKVFSSVSTFDLRIYAMETLRGEFLKPGVLESLKAEIRKVLPEVVAKYLTPKLEKIVESKYSTLFRKRFTKQLANATPDSFPALDLTSRYTDARSPAHATN